MSDFVDRAKAKLESLKEKSGSSSSSAATSPNATATHPPAISINQTAIRSFVSHAGEAHPNASKAAENVVKSYAYLEKQSEKLSGDVDEANAASMEVLRALGGESIATPAAAIKPQSEGKEDEEGKEVPTGQKTIEATKLLSLNTERLQALGQKFCRVTRSRIETFDDEDHNNNNNNDATTDGKLLRDDSTYRQRGKTFCVRFDKEWSLVPENTEAVQEAIESAIPHEQEAIAKRIAVAGAEAKAA